MSNLAATHAMVERRCEQRLSVVTRLIDDATRLRDLALEEEYEERRDPPSSYLDGPELEDHFRPLRKVLNEALLVGTSQTRDAAERIVKATERYVWDWKSADYTALDQALIDFRAAARADLGIEAGEPEKAASKPIGRPRGASVSDQ